ncbi:MAG: Urease accessory protein UreF [Proteobacteria bacterium]|nr:Urease accessory protein UreF [Pseudomonadota bacterium]
MRVRACSGDTMATDRLSHHGLLQLLRLASPALPVGAYAYSQGLEWAVESGWVSDERSAADWIGGVLGAAPAQLEVPVLARLYRAWANDDLAQVHHWSRYLDAARESGELQAEARQLGESLAVLLTQLGIDAAQPWKEIEYAGFPTLFALAAVHHCVPLPETALGFLWAWCENQVAAAIKLVPLGQAAGQRILSTLIEQLPAAAERGLALADDEIGVLAPRLAIGSARHETQYTRLFRS